MAANPPPDLVLAPLDGRTRTVRELLTTFHLLFVAVDPSNVRSRWIVPTAARVLTEYEQADCRVAWLVAGDAADARKFLGRWATDIMTFADPALTAIKGFGLASLPAIVHLGQDGTIVNAVEGWDPPEWHALTGELSRLMRWSKPHIPVEGDPGPFAGAPLPRV
ncbi:MAG: hypothetical protein M3066_20730 [Actinomycetota bacterium]|nr:hypothetical protein [Actinomycetota bacterium]